MSEIKLKPCPFCGGEAELIGEYSNIFVFCSECRCSTEILNTERKAIQAWNTRKPVEAVLDRLEDEILERLSDCGDDWYEAGLINEAIDIVKEGLK